MPALPVVSLEQYAGIRAALADGHALEAVLRQEGVPAWRWPQLDLDHTDAITKDPELFERYCAKLAEAEDALVRKVAPLDSDLSAWAGFVAAFSADAALLAQHELGAGDVKRLQRLWQRRFEADPKLSEQAQKLASNPPAAPTVLEVEPAELRRFSWSPGAEQAEGASALEPLSFLAETAKGARKRAGPTLPFAGYRPPPPGTLEIEHTTMLGETAPIGKGRQARLPATPFEPAVEAAVESARAVATVEAATAAFVRPMTAPSRAEPPWSSALEPIATLASTAEGVLPPSQPALPFSGQRQPQAAVVWDLEMAAEMGQTAPLGATLPQTATPFEEARGSEVAPSASPPNASPPPSWPVSSWTPEHYGHFCAELDAAGPHRSQVLARWGVADEQQRRALERHWLERFLADPALRDRFVAALLQGRPSQR